MTDDELTPDQAARLDAALKEVYSKPLTPLDGPDNEVEIYLSPRDLASVVIRVCNSDQVQGKSIEYLAATIARELL